MKKLNSSKKWLIQIWKEKNKIITDAYQIKIDIGNPLEQNNEDNKGSNCKSEKQIENISKEESEVNKENI